MNKCKEQQQAISIWFYKICKAGVDADFLHFPPQFFVRLPLLLRPCFTHYVPILFFPTPLKFSKEVWRIPWASHNAQQNENQLQKSEGTKYTRSLVISKVGGGASHGFRRLVAPMHGSPRSHLYIGWQWRDFVPYLCQLIFAAIL